MRPAVDAAEALLDWQVMETGACGRYRFPASLPLFAGHFPTRPLVPAVHLLACACDLVRRWRDDPDLMLQECRSARFLRPVPPETVLVVELAEDGSGYRFRLRREDEDERAAEGLLALGHA